MSQTVKLYDCEGDHYYDIVLSDEDAFKARDDPNYAQTLLMHARATTNIKSSPTAEYQEDTEPIIVSITSNFNQSAEKCSWSFEEAVCLINLVEAHYEDMNHPRKRKDIWDIISKEMEQSGYIRTPKNCSEKWKNLYRTYKSCKYIKTKSGRGPIRFMYFDQCDAFLSDKMDIRLAPVDIQTPNPASEISPWSFNESVALINSAKIHYEAIQHPRKRKEVWDIISSDLDRSGYSRTAKQCSDKWKNLYRTYKSCRDSKSNPLRGPMRFMYYDQLHEILDEKAEMPDTNLPTISILDMQETEPKPNAEEFDFIETEESAEDFLKATKKRKITFSNYFEQRTLEWKMRRAEKNSEREKREQRHREKMALLKQKIEIEKRILDVLKANN